jgi:alkylation response protein AidB-like acyl-CoA dehydrogenase
MTEITLENKMVREAIRDWVAKECPRDNIHEWDAADRFPDTLGKKLARLGFCAMTVSEENGGEGRNIQGACIVAEEIAARFLPLARWYTHQAFLGGLVLEALGSPIQRRSLAAEAARGRWLVTPAGIEETQAEMAIYRLGDPQGQPETFLVHGEAAFVTLADQAQCFLVPARAENPGGAVTVFLVPADRQGVAVAAVPKIGCRGAGYGRVALDGVALGADDILGGGEARDRGEAAWQRIVAVCRLMTAAEALGLARGVFDYTLTYARQRIQFGQAIGKFAALRNRFAEMSCDIEAAGLLVAQAARCADSDLAFHREAAAARLKAGEAALRCAMQGLQIFGGYGYTMEYDVQRYVRDAAGLGAAADGEEAARDHIAALLGL